MSEVVDVMSNRRAGVEYVMEPLRTAPNQVQSTLLEDTAQSEPRPSETDLEIFRMKGIAEMELFTMKGKNIAENQQSEDLDLEMVVKARKWVGVVVQNELHGRGNAVSFNAETALYKIEYEDRSADEVGFIELQRIMVPPVLINGYLDRTKPSWLTEEDNEKRKRHMSDEPVPVHPRYLATASQQPAEAEPKRRRTRKPHTASTYVPLAYTQKKRDEYYYYF